jgi:1-deoxy-D-xylulose-5-phosphate reductoisomerase
MATPVSRLDLVEIGQLTFEAPDSERFPALRLARQALQAGGSAPTVLNAANEAAVAAFLAGKLGFLGIAEVVDRTLEEIAAVPLGGLDEVWQIDQEARRIATSMFNRTL